jgi:autotransporter-associated beta strand protein
MGSTNNGVSAIIENAATTAGTLVINQSTPASTEVVWNVHMRDGTLNSEFFAPGATPVASAALNIVKAGDGWATLQTDNAHTGTTTVNAGILQVGKNGVGDTGATNAAGFTSVLGTVVAGTGTIQGLTSIAGALRPGDEAGSLMGTLMVNGNLTLAATSVSTFQAQRASYTAMNVLGMHDAGYGAWSTTTATDPTYSHLLNDPVTTAQHDKLIATGSLTVTAGGKFVLANNGYNPTAGDIFNVLDWTGGALSLNLGGISYNGGLFRTGAETGTDLDLFELGNGFLYDLSQFNSTGNIIVVQANTRQLYWNGDVDGAWNTNTLGNTNWLDAPAGSDPAGTPAFTDDVHFSATTVGSGGSSTTLGANFTVNTVNFGAGANTTTGATVNTGTNTLTVVNGITQASGSAANTISGTGPGGVVLAQSQTWTNNSANDLTVSAPVSGTANLTKAGTGRLILSGANTYTGTTSVNVGTLRASHGSALGGTLQGTTVASGATLELSGGITVTGEALTLNGTGDGGNGALRNESGNNTFAGNITLASNSTIQSDVPGDVLVLGVAAGSAISGVDASVTFTGDGDTTVAGAISLGTGSLTKDGTGILILEGSNTYTGTTTVSNGVLAINGNNSGATGDVTVGANGILGGNGTVGGNTQVFGSVSTGANPDIFQIGTLNFNGKDVTFNDNSSWFVDLVRDTNNMGDQISNVGAFSIGSNVSLNLVSDLSTFVYGNTYTIATYSSFAGGEFSGFAQGGVLSGYQINYGSNAITLTAVPEPGTLGLLGLALGGFFFRRIRRRRADLALVDSEKSEA